MKNNKLDFEQTSGDELLRPYQNNTLFDVPAYERERLSLAASVRLRGYVHARDRAHKNWHRIGNRSRSFSSVDAPQSHTQHQCG